MSTLESIARSVAASARHPLHRQAKMAVPGEGPARARIMLIGEAPGKTEDATGRPFVGRAGKFLDRELASVGLDRRKLFITSVLKFYPPQGKVRPEDVELSLPWLSAQIRAIRPVAVLLMGNVARGVKDLLPPGPRYFESVHPAAAMRFPNDRLGFRRDLRRVAKGG